MKSRQLPASALAALSLVAGGTFAEAQRQPGGGGAMLERTFWACDYAATKHGVHFTPMDICASATEALKHHKFGGDYERMVQWWHERKPDEHQKLRREERLQAELQAPGRPMTAR